MLLGFNQLTHRFSKSTVDRLPPASLNPEICATKLLHPSVFSKNLTTKNSTLFPFYRNLTTNLYKKIADLCHKMPGELLFIDSSVTLSFIAWPSEKQNR